MILFLKFSSNTVPSNLKTCDPQTHTLHGRSIAATDTPLVQKGAKQEMHRSLCSIAIRKSSREGVGNFLIRPWSYSCPEMTVCGSWLYTLVR